MQVKSSWHSSSAGWNRQEAASHNNPSSAQELRSRNYVINDVGVDHQCVCVCDLHQIINV